MWIRGVIDDIVCIVNILEKWRSQETADENHCWVLQTKVSSLAYPALYQKARQHDHDPVRRVISLTRYTNPWSSRIFTLIILQLPRGKRSPIHFRIALKRLVCFVNKDIFILILDFHILTAPIVTSQKNHKAYMWQARTTENKASNEKIVSKTLNLGTWLNSNLTIKRGPCHLQEWYGCLARGSVGRVLLVSTTT